MTSGIITLISVAVNALAAIFAPVIARRLAAQRENLKKAEQTIELVGAGLRVVEQAVEENKDELSQTGAGDRIARTIRSYGPAAKELVDAARLATKKLRENAVTAYEAEVIEREHREHDERQELGAAN